MKDEDFSATERVLKLIYQRYNNIHILTALLSLYFGMASSYFESYVKATVRRKNIPEH